MPRTLKPRGVVALRYFANGLTAQYNASLSVAVDGWCNAGNARNGVANYANTFPRAVSISFYRLWRMRYITARWWWQDSHWRYKITNQGLAALRAVDPIGKNGPNDPGFAVIDLAPGNAPARPADQGNASGSPRRDGF